jgi:hypothetical protein
VTVYYVLPLNHSSTGAISATLIVGLLFLFTLMAFQVRSIASSPYPVLRAVEAAAVSVPLVLLLFASAYLAMSGLSAGSFSERLTHTDALYFTVTVFSTVGFGDITAKTETARLVVTGQMVLDIIIIGIAARAIADAVRRGRERLEKSGGAAITKRGQ